MLGCTTTITHLSPDELDTSRIPALARKGADIDNPAIIRRAADDHPDSLQAASWIFQLPCGTEYRLSYTATVQDYATIGDASTLLVQMSADYLPLTLVHALEQLLSAGKVVWLVSVSTFTLTPHPLIYTLYRLCEVQAGDWSYVSIEQFLSEGIARIYLFPDGDPQLMKEDQVGQ